MLLREVTGAVLRRIRLDQGRTLREVAGDAAISTPYLSEIERGRKEPSSELLAAVAAVLGLTLLDLLDEVRAELDAWGRSAVVVDLTRRREPAHHAPIAAAAPRGVDRVVLAA